MCIFHDTALSHPGTDHNEVFIAMCQNRSRKHNTVNNSEKLELSRLIKNKFFDIRMDRGGVIKNYVE